MAPAATVESIWVTPCSAGEMESRESATLIQGCGIEGDRYAKQEGTYSVMKEPGRQLTIISAESVEAALVAAGMPPLEPLGKLRRNIVVRNMSAAALLEARGHELSLGECTVFVHRNCVPCAYNEARNGHGLMDALWSCSGVNCEVVRGGKLQVGDAVRVVPGSHVPERVDTGGKGELFFKRPKTRTLEEVKAMRRGLASLRPRLESVDPRGVRRVDEAYSKYGLAFWPKEDHKGAVEPSEAIGSRLLGGGGVSGILGLLAVMVPATAIAVAAYFARRNRSEGPKL